MRNGLYLQGKNDVDSWRPFHETSEDRDIQNPAQRNPPHISLVRSIRFGWKSPTELIRVHNGLSFFYAMSEPLEISRILDEQVKVKERESGHPESGHILALGANTSIGGTTCTIWRPMEKRGHSEGHGRKDIPDPTTAGDFCRRFTLGHIL